MGEKLIIENQANLEDAIVKTETTSYIGFTGKDFGCCVYLNEENVPGIVVFTTSEDETQIDTYTRTVKNVLVNNRFKADPYSLAALTASSESFDVDCEVVKLKEFTLKSLLQEPSLIPKPIVDTLAKANSESKLIVSNNLLKTFLEVLSSDDYFVEFNNQFSEMTLTALVTRLEEIESIDSSAFDELKDSKPSMIFGKGFNSVPTYAANRIFTAFYNELPSDYRRVCDYIHSKFMGDQGHSRDDIYLDLQSDQTLGLSEEDLQLLKSLIEQKVQSSGSRWVVYREGFYRNWFLALSTPADVRQDLLSNSLNVSDEQYLDNLLKIEGVRLLLVSILRRYQRGVSLDEILVTSSQ